MIYIHTILCRVIQYMVYIYSAFVKTPLFILEVQQVYKHKIHTFALYLNAVVYMSLSKQLPSYRSSVT